MAKLRAISGVRIPTNYACLPAPTDVTTYTVRTYNDYRNQDCKRFLMVKKALKPVLSDYRKPLGRRGPPLKPLGGKALRATTPRPP